MSISKEDQVRIISNFNNQNLQPLVKAFKDPIEAANFLHQNKGQLDSKVKENFLEGRISVGDDDGTDLITAYNAIGNLKNGKLQDALQGLSELDITGPTQIADFFYKNRYEVKPETLQKMLNSDGMQEVSNEFNIRRDNDAIKLFQKTFNRDRTNDKLNGINTTKDIADYLYPNPTLDKEKLGEYLSHDSCIGVLDQFTKKMDFADKGFVDGMRAYLDTFKLPGEAQRIDRIMESFGKHYVTNGKDWEQFASADAAYVMAFNTIVKAVELS